MATTNIDILLNVTRRSAELEGDLRPWRALIEKLDDAAIQHLCKQCTPKELYNVAYYLIALYRVDALKWWWNRNSLPKPTVDGIFNALHALQLYRLNKVKHRPTPMLLAILKSKLLRKLYPEILDWERLHNCPQPEKREQYSNPDELVPELRLRTVLVEIISAIPGGASILWNEWDRYDYPRDIVWGIGIPYQHSTMADEYNLSVNYNVVQGSEYYTPVHQILRYGTVKDLRVALTLSKYDLWFDNGQFPRGCQTLLAFLAMNTNRNTYRYFMEYVWTARKACCTGNCYLVNELIWENCWLSKILTEEYIEKSLARIVQAKGWRHKIKMLQWLLPKVCTPRVTNKYLEKHQILTLMPNSLYCSYNYYHLARPIHPDPEHILAVAKNAPLITPKADGVYFRDVLPDDVYPTQYYRCEIQAEKLTFQGLQLYIVFDASRDGGLQDRIYKYARAHYYCDHPYPNLGAEHEAFTQFIAKAKASGQKKVWWPKGVYTAPTGRDFFYLLSQTPATPYPNDGWVIAGNKGGLWKMKPREQLTLDLTYNANTGWSAGSTNYDYLTITEFPTTELPRGIPHDRLIEYIRQMFEAYPAGGTQLERIKATIAVVQLISLNNGFLDVHQRFKNVVREKIREAFETPLAKPLIKPFLWLLNDPIVQPKNDQTIYDGFPIYDGVWRCVWDEEQGKWRPHSRRLDKTKSNDYKIAKQLTSQHQYPWNPTELVKYIDSRPYYSQTRGSKTPAIRKAFAAQKKAVGEFLHKNVYNIKSFANLAGGYQHEYVEAYELDPYIAAETGAKWADAATLRNPLTDEKYTLQQTHIAVQKAIHYFAITSVQWKAFLANIQSGHQLYLSVIDADLLFSDSDEHTFPDGSKMIRGKQLWHRGVWTGVSTLKWNGSPVVEPYVSYKFIKEELIAVGWKENDTTTTELGLRLAFWTK